jgi:integrase
MTMTAAMTGMRAGEVRGLQWQDLQPGRILITKALSQDNSAVSLPKWGKVRSCPYPEALAALLEPLRYASGPVRPADWVFHMDHVPVGYRYWAEAVRRAGRGIPGANLHTLRHTLNTRLREAGVSDELLRGSFGWSAPAIHDNYTHRDKYDYTGQAAAIDEIMGANSESH